jgi:D-alanine-D-alanine ligase
MSLRDKRIGVLFGGHNAEHEVSVRTGAALSRALRVRGYNVVDIEVKADLAEVLRREGIEVAVLGLHGRTFEDGCLQGLLEIMRIPYTGSNVLASALAMDKVAAKKMFRQAGLPVAEDVVVSPGEIESFEAAKIPFGFPVVVKPAREGSSVGVSMVADPGALAQALRLAARYAGDILIERRIFGREMNIAILDDRALGVLEVVPGDEFYSYQAKYQSQGRTRYLFPAPVEKAVEDELCRQAVAAHRCLGCSGVTRVEILLDRAGKMFLLEVNSLPGMTEASLVPKIAAGAGLSFEDLAERILHGARLWA